MRIESSCFEFIEEYTSLGNFNKISPLKMSYFDVCWKEQTEKKILKKLLRFVNEMLVTEKSTTTFLKNAVTGKDAISL